MKVITFILSVYLLFLFTIPCCIFDNCSDDKIEQAAGNKNRDGDCGNCSPFFSCTGCTGATLSFEYTDLKLLPPIKDQNYAGYILSYIPDVHYEFWQPPRLD